MDFDKADTAVVFIDPQNDVLSEKGKNWGAVGASVTQNRTVENMERIFKAAKANGFEVFISPHYFFPTDSGWKFNGPLEADEAKTKMFQRSGRLSLEGFTRSGADWLERFKPYIEDILREAGPWLDQMFLGVWDGFKGTQDRKSVEELLGLAFECDFFFVSNPDVTARDVAKMRRLSGAVTELLDAAS